MFWHFSFLTPSFFFFFVLFLRKWRCGVDDKHLIVGQAVEVIDVIFDDFMFQLTEQEWSLISSQFVMTSRMKRPKKSL